MSYDLFCEGDHAFPTEERELAPGFKVTLVNTDGFPGAHVKYNNWTFRQLINGMAEYDALDPTPAPTGPISGEDTLAFEGQTGMIPVGKFSDQSGWRVTESEAKATYDKLAGQPVPESLLVDSGAEPEWVGTIWSEFMDFLEHVSSHNGFSVH